jgi:hypothetical protein
VHQVELRKRINDAHEEAIRAFEIIKGYLAQAAPKMNGMPKGGRRRQGSFREQVLAVIRDSWRWAAFEASYTHRLSKIVSRCGM